jgi:hypothetical protein
VKQFSYVKISFISTLRNNSPAFFSVFVGLSNTVLVMRYLGANQVSDVYFLSFYIATVITAFSLMPYEQFMHWHSYFNETQSEIELKDFVSNNIHCSLMTGILIIVLLNIFAEYIARFFGSALNYENIEQITLMLRLLSIGISTAPVIFIMRQYLNINNNYSTPFLFSVIPQILIGLFFLIYKEESSNNIHIAAIFYSMGTIILLIIFFIKIRKYGLGLTKFHPLRKYKKQYLNSIVMKGGGNLHYYSYAYFITNFLSQINPGAFSLFQYADKIVSACHSISAGPIQNKYIVDMSRITNSDHNRSAIFGKTRTYLTNVTFLFFTATVIAYVLIPYVAPYISIQLTSINQVSSLLFLFLGLSCAKYINIFESPLVIYLQSRRGVLPFYIINGFFAIILYGTYIVISERTLGTIILIIIMTSFISLIAYWSWANYEFKRYR